MTDAPAPAADRESGSGRRVVLVGAIVLVITGFVIPVLVAADAGALRIPRSDDWSYLLTLFRWVHSGRLSFNGWVSMTLVGQLVVAAPIAALTGRSILAIHLLSACIGLGGLIALVVLGRRVLGNRRGPMFLAITIACGPLWSPLVTTYMTDVPAFAFQMAALALAGVAFGRRPISMGWLAASLGVGFIGISIRQYGAVPVIAILVVALWVTATDADRRRFRITLVLAGLTGIATAVLLVWWTTLPDALSVSPTTPTIGTLFQTVIGAAGFLRLTGLLLAPVVILAGPVRRLRAAWRSSPELTAALGAGTALLLVVTYVRDTSTPFVGNYVDRLGVLAADVIGGHRAPVMPKALFDVLVGVGTLAGVWLVVAMVPTIVRTGQRLRERDLTRPDPMITVLGLSVVGFSVTYAFAILTGLPIFDRYALPAIPLAGLLVLASGADDELALPAGTPVVVLMRRWAGPVVAVAALGIVSLGFATDSASFDATRWKVAEAVTRHGYPPLQVYGGFEWLAYHRHRGPVLGATVAERQELLKVYFRHLCVTVAVDPTISSKVRPIASAEMTGLFHGPIPMIAFRNDRPCR